MSASSFSIEVANITVSWNNRGDETDFIFISSLGKGVTPGNAWIGIG